MATIKTLYQRHLIKKRSKNFKPNVKKSQRSFWGNVILGLFLLAMALLFFFPVIYMISQSLKPMNEMFIFPPRIIVSDPTMNNYRDFGNILANTVVPVTRSLFNSLFVVAVGSVGHIVLASLCAYPLAKYKFPGCKFFNQIIVYSLMFNATVTMIPNFLTIASLGMLDSQWAIIIPGFASTLGLYLMKNFMEQIPDSLMEAAQIDGATKWERIRHIIIPSVSPTTFFLLISSIITSLQNFTTIQALTGGGPGQATTVMSINIIRTAFSNYQTGYASAQALVMFLIVLVITLIQWRGQKKWVNY